MMKYEHFVRITPQNAVSTETTDNANIYWFYGKINCDSIEIVRLFQHRSAGKHSNVCLIVDEEGRINGSPLNLIASFLACQPIYGTVLIGEIGERDGEPDVVGMSIEVVTAFRLAIHYSLMKSGLFEDAEKDEP